jgi:hypothetical protein
MIPALFTNWTFFVFLFGGMLAVTFFMMIMGNQFFTKDPIRRNFSIMELEIPATGQELVNIIKGIFDLPVEEANRAMRAVRGQLWLDFLFMPLAYGSIAIVCLRVAQKMPLEWLKGIFLVFALLQIIAWICDIVENIYLIIKMKEGTAIRLPSRSIHKAYVRMVSLKWLIALIATAMALAAIAYFWVTGDYSLTSLKSCVIVVAELIVFFLLIKKVA